MDRSTVIDPIDFKFELLKSKDPVERVLPSDKNAKYTTIPFTYNGKEVLLKAEGLFRSFTKFKDGKTSYSITMAMALDESIDGFFTKLELMRFPHMLRSSETHFSSSKRT